MKRFRLNRFYVCLLVILVCSYQNIFAQDTSQQDDMFIDANLLDDLFIDEDSIEAQESETAENSEQEIDNSDNFTNEEASTDDIVEPSRQSLRLLKFSLEEQFSNKWYSEHSKLNPDALFYQAPWSNMLKFNNFAQYKNKHAWLDLQMDYNLFFSMDPTQDSDFSKTYVADTTTSEFQYELKEVWGGIHLLDKKLSLFLGKINRSFGSGFMANPSNPLQRNFGSHVPFAKNLSPRSYSTLTLSSIEREFGSGDDIGYWATELMLNIHPIVWRIAYLPQLETGFAEFDRPEHSMLSSISTNNWDSVKPSLLFFLYGEKYFTGADLSLGMGDYITLHGEFGLSMENELLLLKENGATSYGPNISYKEYLLEPDSDDGVYPSALLGISYTPQIDLQSLATILLEIYYNGKGLWQDEWNQQIALRDDLYNNYNNASQNLASSAAAGVSSKYKGMLNTTRYYYHPLDSRPLYLLLRISRDNVLDKYWRQRLNLATSIIYSLLDTNFMWDCTVEIETQELISLGVTTRYIFGDANGAFTELDETVKTTVYAKISL